MIRWPPMLAAWAVAASLTQSPCLPMGSCSHSTLEATGCIVAVACCCQSRCVSRACLHYTIIMSLCLLIVLWCAIVDSEGCSSSCRQRMLFYVVHKFAKGSSQGRPQRHRCSHSTCHVHSTCWQQRAPPEVCTMQGVAVVQRLSRVVHNKNVLVSPCWQSRLHPVHGGGWQESMLQQHCWCTSNALVISMMYWRVLLHQQPWLTA